MKTLFGDSKKTNLPVSGSRTIQSLTQKKEAAIVVIRAVSFVAFTAV